MPDNVASLASLLKANDTKSLPLSTYAGLNNQPTVGDTEAQNLADIAGGIAPANPLSAILKGLTQGASMTKKEKAQAQRDALNAQLQKLAEWEVGQKQHQAEMEDLLQSHTVAMSKQGAFMDGLKSVMNGGDPQALVDLMNSDGAMARTAARQFGVDPASQLVDIQVTNDRNGQPHLIGTFSDGQNRFTAPEQVPFSKVASAIAPALLEQRAAEAAQQSLETRKTMAGIMKDEAAARKDNAEASNGGQPPPKPLPATALKIQNDELSTLGQLSGVNADIQKIIDQIDSGKLETGLAARGEAWLRNNTNSSTEQTRNLATLQSNLEGIRNGVLLLNKGVQTEGDAQRAMDQILSNVNDTQLVKKRLQELMATNGRAADLRKANIDALRSNYGHEPLDYSKFTDVPAAVVTPPTANGAQDATAPTPREQTLQAPDLNAIDAELRKRGVLK